MSLLSTSYSRLFNRKYRGCCSTRRRLILFLSVRTIFFLLFDHHGVIIWIIKKYSRSLGILA